VLQRILGDKAYKVVAYEMGISEGMVKVHVSSILQKVREATGLEIKNRTALMAWCFEQKTSFGVTDAKQPVNQNISTQEPVRPVEGIVADSSLLPALIPCGGKV
jgi:DNA-binding CsgD family transcriptional regulator